MHLITIKIAESTYNAAKENAARRGYLSVEEYMSDWLENEATSELPMTPELALALEAGLTDSRNDRVISIEEYKRRHAEMRTAWIQAHPA